MSAERPTTRGWLAPLAATLTLQVTSSYLSRLAPALAPVLTLQAGLAPTAIGHLSALNALGSIAFLVMGAPLLRRVGPIRALQIGTLCSVAGVLLMLWPGAATLMIASFLIGVGYGPSPPAGSEILQRHAPPHRRALIFSIKQAGVPVGGVAAGVALPPLAAIDWRVAVAVAAFVGLLTVFAVQPLRDAIDRDRRRDQLISARAFLAWSNVTSPIRALGMVPALAPLTAAAICFAVAQGVLFAFFVTYAVAELGFSLTAAGGMFALMQLAGVFGRILLGWVADRARSTAAVLCWLAVAAAATSAALALSAATWPAWSIAAIAAISGVTIASWNGVFLSEIARLAPPSHIGEASAGSTLVTFLGYVVGPAAFALLVEVTGAYRVAFAAVVCISLAALVFLIPLARSRA